MTMRKATPCRFQGTVTGCRFGATCRYSHETTSPLPPPENQSHRSADQHQGQWEPSSKQSGMRKRRPLHAQANSKTTAPTLGDTIPGFYFDTEKKKYFRLPPGTPCVATASPAISSRAAAASLGVVDGDAGRQQSVAGLLPRLQLRAQLGNRRWRRVAVTCARTVVAARLKWPGAAMTAMARARQLDLQVHASGQYVATTLSSSAGAVVYQLRSSRAGRPKYLAPRAHVPPFGLNGGFRWAPQQVGDHQLLYAAFAGAGLQVVSCEPELWQRTHQVFLPSSNGEHYWDCAWSTDSTLVAAGTCSGVHVYDWVAGVERRRLRNRNNSAVLATAFDSSNSQLLYFGSRDGRVRLADLRQQRSVVWAIPQRRLSISCLRTLPDDSHGLLCATMSGELALWDTRDGGQCVQRYEGHTGSHQQVDLTVNQNLGMLGALGADNTWRLWDVQAREPIRTFRAPMGVITAATLCQGSSLQVYYIANEQIHLCM